MTEEIHIGEVLGAVPIRCTLMIRGKANSPPCLRWALEGVEDGRWNHTIGLLKAQAIGLGKLLAEMALGCGTWHLVAFMWLSRHQPLSIGKHVHHVVPTKSHMVDGHDGVHYGVVRFVKVDRICQRKIKQSIDHA